MFFYGLPRFAKKARNDGVVAVPRSTFCAEVGGFFTLGLIAFFKDSRDCGGARIRFLLAHCLSRQYFGARIGALQISQGR